MTYLTKLLRHDIIKENLTIDNAGYVCIDEIIDKIPKFRNFTKDDFCKIVEKDNKQRYSMYQKDNGKWYIKANQGHSQQVGNLIDDDISMRRIIIPIPNVFHGTYMRFIDDITTNGLNRMNRKHIHISKGFNVLSGRRKDCDVLIYIDMDKAINDGMIFYESDNGVILTEGFNGIIESKYFSKVESI